MSEKTTDLTQAVALALALSPLDKIRLVERVMATLENDLAESEKQPRRALRGILADTGPAPSAEEIDQARREMWRNFPHEDI